MPKVVDVELRRRELTDAAARVIARSGLVAASMREIAAEAGSTTGALTHYFADKSDLLLATFQASLSGRISRRPSLANATAAERLRSTLEGALPLNDEQRLHWLVTMSCAIQAVGDERLAQAQRDAYREFRQHVTTLVAELDPGDAHPEATAETLIGAVDGVAVQAIFDPETWPPHRQLERVAAVLGHSGFHFL